MTTFTAITDSTIYDVCLNTHGTLNKLGQLMDENDWEGVNTYPEQGDEFTFDETKVNLPGYQNLNNNFNVIAGATQIKFATK